jgi:hypothetical protein
MVSWYSINHVICIDWKEDDIEHMLVGYQTNAKKWRSEGSSVQVMQYGALIVDLLLPSQARSM